MFGSGGSGAVRGRGAEGTGHAARPRAFVACAFAASLLLASAMALVAPMGVWPQPDPDGSVSPPANALADDGADRAADVGADRAADVGVGATADDRAGATADDRAGATADDRAGATADDRAGATADDKAGATADVGADRADTPPSTVGPTTTPAGLSPPSMEAGGSDPNDAYPDMAVASDGGSGETVSGGDAGGGGDGGGDAGGGAEGGGDAGGVPPDMTTYADTELTYAFEHPADWVPTDGYEGVDAMMVAPDLTSFSVAVTGIELSMAGYTAEDYREAYREYLPGMALVRFGQYYAAGYRGVRISFTNDAGGLSVRYDQFVFSAHGRQYILTFAYLADKADALADTVEAVVSSFRLLP